MTKCDTSGSIQRWQLEKTGAELDIVWVAKYLFTSPVLSDTAFLPVLEVSLAAAVQPQQSRCPTAVKSVTKQRSWHVKQVLQTMSEAFSN